MAGFDLDNSTGLLTTFSDRLIEEFEQNIDINHSNSSYHSICHGIILPEWPIYQDSDVGTYFLHAFVYILALAYLLFGVSIVTDRIVSAMEVIASQKRKTIVILRSGNAKAVETLVWHEVVVSLTVFAIGTSAPEIFLPTIEMFKLGFRSNELGPALIVGSGAYHFFVITGVCLLSVKETTAKPIEDRFVFFTTTLFAILAYLWVYVIIEQISPNEIEIWEAILTLGFFPILVVITWAISKRFPHNVFQKAVKRIQRKNNNVLPLPSNGLIGRRLSQLGGIDNSDIDMERLSEQERAELIKRRKLAAILQSLKQNHPEKSQDELEGKFDFDD